VNSAEANAVEIRLLADSDEQVTIATTLSDIDAEVAALEARRNKAKDIKQAMMQELLTGKTTCPCHTTIGPFNKLIIQASFYCML
jgi:type I restriction enzyme, S subunit